MTQRSRGLPVRELITQYGLVELDPDKWTRMINTYMDFLEVSDIRRVPVEAVFEWLKKHAVTSAEEEHLLALIKLLDHDEAVRQLKNRLAKNLSNVAAKLRESTETFVNINADLRELGKQLSGNNDRLRSAVWSVSGLAELEAEIMDLHEKLQLHLTELCSQAGYLTKSEFQKAFLEDSLEHSESTAHAQLKSAFSAIKCKLNGHLNDWLNTTAEIQVKKCSTEDELNKEQQQQQQKLLDDLREKADSWLGTAGRHLVEAFDPQTSDKEPLRNLGPTNSLTEHVSSVRKDMEMKLRIMCDYQRLEILHAVFESKILYEAKVIVGKMKNASIADVEKVCENLCGNVAQLKENRLYTRYNSIRSQFLEFLTDVCDHEFPFFRPYDLMESLSNNLPSLELSMNDLFGISEFDFLEFDEGVIKTVTLSNSRELVKVAYSFNPKKLSEAKETVLRECNQIFLALGSELADIKKQNCLFDESDVRRIKQVVSQGLKDAQLSFNGFRTTNEFQRKLVNIAMERVHPVLFAIDLKIQENYYTTNEGILRQFKNKIKHEFAHGNVAKR